MKLKDLVGTWEAIAIFKTDMTIGEENIPMYYENRDKIIAIIKAKVEAQGCRDFKVEGNTCYFGNQFYNLPNMPEKRIGKIQFRSKDYAFSCPEWKEGRESYGTRPKASDLTDKGFIIESLNGHIEYQLLRKV